MRKQRRRSAAACAVTAQLFSALVFATWIVQSLFYLNPKFQAFSHLLWVYSLVCVRPGRKPRRPVFSQRGSIGAGSGTYLSQETLYRSESCTKKSKRTTPCGPPGMHNFNVIAVKECDLKLCIRPPCFIPICFHFQQFNIFSNKEF